MLGAELGFKGKRRLFTIEYIRFFEEDNAITFIFK